MRRAALLLLMVTAAMVNKSTAWSTEDDESLNDVDGGFPSLDGMLQWAIGHSDPAHLQMEAQVLSSDQLLKRQLEIKQVLDQFEEMPSDAKLLQTALHDFANSSLSLEHHLRALDHLSILVEDIHNANAMHKMGGLSLLIRGFSNSDPLIRITCASILAKASQNNPLLQTQVLQLGALPKLMLMVTSTHLQESIKALYAVSAIISNNQNGLHSFYTQAGHLMLQAILGNATADVRLHKRALSLVADLAQFQFQFNQQQLPSFLNSCDLLRLLIRFTTSHDLDLQEKVLLAIKNILMLKSTQVVDGFCGLKGALERMIQQLQNLNTDYAIDVQGLCKEVNMIYLEKLNNKVNPPTSSENKLY